MSAAIVAEAPDAPAKLSVTRTLFDGCPAPDCCACVVVPVRNEEASLARCLDALQSQVNLCGSRLPMSWYEVILLLNNCNDNSMAVAQAWRQDHPEMMLLIAERTFLASDAHAGTARKLLMDTAWSRLERRSSEGGCAILGTDADSAVAPDWIAQNLRALRAGADAVGGLIALHEEEVAALPSRVRWCYERDRRYATLVAALEDRLDPQPGDPWPRHLDHFGSSLACTASAYARVGGMPASAVLEDEAFVDRLRRADLRLRHEPAVRVYTSARLQGRATTGLAGQLRQWGELGCDEDHRVQSAAFLEHRFRTLRMLREGFHGVPSQRIGALSGVWAARFHEALWSAVSVPEFLAALDCDALIQESFEGVREEPIGEAIAALEAMVAAGVDAPGAQVEAFLEVVHHAPKP